jgi:hypothetical protein
LLQPSLFFPGENGDKGFFARVAEISESILKASCDPAATAARTSAVLLHVRATRFRNRCGSCEPRLTGIGKIVEMLLDASTDAAFSGLDIHHNAF